MADLLIADVSTYQGTVDWAVYAAAGFRAAIARLTDGVAIVDSQAAANLAGMRAHLACRGWYHYLTAGDDPAAQARFFCAVLKSLLAGEFIVVDEEEGAGNQEPRAAVFLATVNQQLGLVQVQDVEYSGLNYVTAHGGWVPGVTRWVAAYQPAEPAAGQTLWQKADNVTFPGIAKPCDGTVFHGTVDQLIALVTPQQEDPMDRVYIMHSPTRQAVYNLDRGWKIELGDGADGSLFTGPAPAGFGLAYMGPVSEKFFDAVPARTGSVA